MRSRLLRGLARVVLAYCLGVVASLIIALVASQAATFPSAPPRLWSIRRDPNRFYLDLHRTWGAKRTIWMFYSTWEPVPTQSEQLAAARQRTHEIFYRVQERTGYRNADGLTARLSKGLPAEDPMPYERGAIDAYGWPYESLTCSLRAEPYRGTWAATSCVGGRLLRERGRQSTLESARVMPMTIDVAGTLGNGLVFSAAPAGLILGLRTLRRRSRRHKGQCERCGYSITGLAARAVCPECGGATQPRERPSSPGAADEPRTQ